MSNHIITEDHVELVEGDQAYDYYDFNLGTIHDIDASGWFDLVTEDGRRLYRNGQRVCSVAFAQRRGWV
jgi:hypothetical protein